MKGKSGRLAAGRGFDSARGHAGLDLAEEPAGRQREKAQCAPPGKRRLNARRRVRETMDSIDIMRYPGTRYNPSRNGRSHKRKAAAGGSRRCFGVLAAVALEYYL